MEKNECFQMKIRNFPKLLFLNALDLLKTISYKTNLEQIDKNYIASFCTSLWTRLFISD